MSSDRQALAVGGAVLATRNRHKLEEFRRVLTPLGIEVKPLPDEVELPPEDGLTFEANALPKARTAAARTGALSVADDSGIEAEALGGRPGVFSARYAGPQASDEENLVKFIREVPPGSRLRYVCVVAYVNPHDGTEHVFEGECRGRMAAERRGNRGFGYDPVFVPDDDPQQRTMAELSESEKDAISHRGRALRALVEWLAP